MTASAPIVAIVQAKFQLPALLLAAVIRTDVTLDAGAVVVANDAMAPALFEAITTIQLRI